MCHDVASSPQGFMKERIIHQTKKFSFTAGTECDEAMDHSSVVFNRLISGKKRDFSALQQCTAIIVGGRRVAVSAVAGHPEKRNWLLSSMRRPGVTGISKSG